jgi:hypothetical protein
LLSTLLCLELQWIVVLQLPPLLLLLLLQEAAAGVLPELMLMALLV